mmetsp:Transcript_9900/g.15239  ORF Transcript_9900/g.15239 Transcript_9900/m.15239 type:complete len:104 (-) Transcript_9900:288-599(-)
MCRTGGLEEDTPNTLDNTLTVSIVVAACTDLTRTVTEFGGKNWRGSCTFKPGRRRLFVLVALAVDEDPSARIFLFAMPRLCRRFSCDKDESIADDDPCSIAFE